jgi:protein TonB
MILKQTISIIFLLIFIESNGQIKHINYIAENSDCSIKNVKTEKEMQSIIKDSTCISKPDTLDNQQVYINVDKEAEFPGGNSALIKYISTNLQYPGEFAEWQGSIYVTFIVDNLGIIRHECIYIHHFEEITPIEIEALKLIKGMPKWTPAEIDGNKVYSRRYLPIKF